MAAPEPYDWIIRFTVEMLLIFTFLLVLLPSLWKLVMSRPGLIIVFSRSFGNFCRLLGDLPGFFIYYMLQIWTDQTPPAFVYTTNSITRILTIVQHTHNLALAVNRAHAMFFPFNYQFVYLKKRNVYLICVFLWLLAICAAISDQILQYKGLIYLNNTPTFMLSKYCMYAAGLVYAALGCRMLWMKYKSRPLNGSSTEKDALKILVVCFSCLTMSTLYQLVFQPSVPYFNDFSYTVQRVAFWVYNSSIWLGLCTEEISLCLLVRDFRKHVKQRVRAIFPCCGKVSIVGGNTGATIISTVPQQQQHRRQTTNAAVVNSNILRVTASIGSTYRRGQ